MKKIGCCCWRLMREQLFQARRPQREGSGGVAGAGPYELVGKRITCPHCGYEEFSITQEYINFIRGYASILTCINCGQIQWFNKRPQKA